MDFRTDRISNGYRSGLDILQSRNDIYRFYPLIDWTQSQIDDYFNYFDYLLTHLCQWVSIL